jgi:hypothetical protein
MEEAKMTAVTQPEKAFYSDPRNPPRCTLCRHKAEVPYIEWSGGLSGSAGSHTIIVCAHCCRSSDGFVADLKTVKSAVIARREPFRMGWVSDARQ